MYEYRTYRDLLVFYPPGSTSSRTVLYCTVLYCTVTLLVAIFYSYRPGADSVRWEGLCLQQSPEAVRVLVSPRGALGPGGLWFLVMCTLDGPSLA